MKSGKQKPKLTVKLNPLEGESFDIRHPEKSADDTKKAPPASDMRRFFWFALFAFIALVCLSIFFNGSQFIGKNKDTAYQGVSELESGISSMKSSDFSGASEMFAKAMASFEKINSGMQMMSGQADRYIGQGMYLDSARKLAESGVIFSQIGIEASEAMKQLKSLPEVFAGQNRGGKVKITSVLADEKARLQDITAKTEKIQNNLTSVDISVLPADLKDSVSKAREYLGTALFALKKINVYASAVMKLLGDKVPHRYLILFQNNHELRATGGFIGSYMLMDVNDGLITKMEFKDVYDTDGQLTDVVPAPPGIDKVADRLYMRDANYSPDFPSSAKQIMWFLEHSRGPSVDTVIAIDQTVAEKLLGLIGPINIESLKFTVDSKNFNDFFSYYIESKSAGAESPKSILMDFIPEVKTRLFSLKDHTAILDSAEYLITGKHIQAYSSDSEAEELFKSLKMDGSLLKPDKGTDYLFAVTTAIGGNKSDAFMKTEFAHKTMISAEGWLTDTLTVTKFHSWKESDFSGWAELIKKFGNKDTDAEQLKMIQGKGANTDYMRIYVPEGSRLISAQGIDKQKVSVFVDSGYTVFGFTFGPLDPGAEKVIRLEYSLPFDIEMTPSGIYRFVAQNQSGSSDVTLKKSIGSDEGVKILKTFPATRTGAFSIYPEYGSSLDSNRIFVSAVGR